MIRPHPALLATCLLACTQADAAADDLDRHGDPLPPGAVARLGTERLGHPAVIQQLAFAPDGRTIVSSSGSVRFWDASTGRMLREMATDDLKDMIRSLALAPDGKTLAYIQGGRWVNVLDAETGRRLHRLPGHKMFADSVAFAPGGGSLASGGRDGFIRIWDAATGKPLQTLPYSGQISFLAYRPDGKTLLSYADTFPGTECVLWDLATGKVLRRWEQARGPVALSADGTTLALGARGPRLLLYDAATGKELRQLLVSTRRAALSPDGRFLVARESVAAYPDAGWEHSKGSSPQLWDLTAREPRPAELWPEFASAAAFSPDGWLVALAVGREVVLVERVTGKEVLRRKGHGAGMYALAFASDGRLLASGSDDLTALVWDATGLVRGGRPPAPRTSPENLEAAWADLAGADAWWAHRAVWRLAFAPEQAVPFLAKRVRPASPVEPPRLAKLIGDLDSKSFAVRERATRELETLGGRAVPALREALGAKPMPEARARLERVLKHINGPPEAEELRALRAVAALGRAGGPEARKLLDELAGGVPEARLTQEARAARKWLAARGEGTR